MTMLRALTLLLALLIGSCAKEPAPAAPATAAGKGTIMSPAEFTQDFASVLFSKNLKVQVLYDLKLRVTRADGTTFDSNLDNPYAEYKLDASKKSDVIQRYIPSLLSLVKNDTAIDKVMVPMLKSKTWVENANRLKAQAKVPSKLLCDGFAGELMVVYAEDQQDTIQYVDASYLSTANIHPEDALGLATKNLLKVLPKIERHGENGVYMFTAGGTYETSLLLIDSIWDKDKIPVKGDFVAAVPNRDILLVTGSDDLEGLKKLREAAANMVNTGSYPLTTQLFARRDGHWIEFKEAP